uniref:Uncharacterized protein n=1 Tax=Siphoviridae sp. ctcPV5 TaxID=2827582 RepID=A0A8S5LL18_9CAUD|nr:MAG TPA: hypothetical protein [Siphoviridae sp. ctcPV5]
MTNKELIELLKEFPENAQAFVFNPCSVDFERVIKIDSTFENGGEPVIIFRD